MTHHPMRESVTALMVLLMLLALPACTDGGGDRASGVEPGPTPPNGPIIPPPPIIGDSIAADDIRADDTLTVTINDLSYDDADKLTLNFSVAANGVQSVTGLTSRNLGFSLARLVDNPGDAAGQRWSSYILGEEDPVCRRLDDTNVSNRNNDCTTFELSANPDLIGRSDLKVRDGEDNDDSNGVAVGKVVVSQAATETSKDQNNDKTESGDLVANQDGSWSYTYYQDMGNPALRGEVHRACIQFSFNAELDSICIDFIPSAVADSNIGARGSSLADDFYANHNARQIAVEATCNTCHDKLALHGGRRTTVDYCVTCHNPDTTDANSTNTMDLKVLVHKLHNGRNLPTLTDGKPYKTWGYNNGEHDYSTLSYPQKMIRCSRCHAGQEDIEFAQVQGLPMPEAVITADGHNWVSNPTLSACTSCHEKLVTENKKLDGKEPTTDHTSYTEASNCAGCHRDRGPTDPGRLQANQAHRDKADEAGLNLQIVIEEVTNTAANQKPQVKFSIQDASGNKLDLKNSEAPGCATAKWDLRMPYDAAGEYLAQISGSGSAASLAAAGDDNDFIMEPSAAVPATSVDTISAMIDWNYPLDCDDPSGKARLNAALSYESSPEGSPSARRTITDVKRCNACHYRMLETQQKHSGTRSVNSPEACVACHNAEFATSNRSREMAVMTHALHASGIRDSAHGSYNKIRLQYPGDLSDCESCHVEGSQLLPLPVQRQAILTTRDPTYTSPIAAVCSSCHDDSAATLHMETSGGAIFDADFDSANITESCDVCHGRGKTADVDRVHNK